jgi:hypothetical protein
MLDARSGDLRTCTAVKRVAIVLAAAAALSSARAEPILPTATGTMWTYQMVQEFGKGVHPSTDENAKLVPCHGQRKAGPWGNTAWKFTMAINWRRP